jgi:hypothetical protein
VQEQPLPRGEAGDRQACANREVDVARQGCEVARSRSRRSVQVEGQDSSVGTNPDA